MAMKTKIILTVFCSVIAAKAQTQNLFVSDGNNGPGMGIIYKFTPDGARSVFVSGLDYPQGLAFNSAGDLFEGDSLAGGIFEFTPGGVQSTFASGALSGVVGAPAGLAFNSGGNLFVAGPQTGVIYQYTPGGVRSIFASGLASAGLAFDGASNLFVAEWMINGDIVEITPSGAQSTFATGLYDPEGLAFNSAGDLFVADSGSGNIYKFTPGGARSTFASGLNNPIGLVFNSTGNLFVTSASGNILEFTPDGTKTIFASGLLPWQQTFLAFQPVPPVLRIISQSNGSQFVIGVCGVLGQKIVLQSSPDLQNWLPLATNTLTSICWTYTNNAPQSCGQQFYRALWLQ
jgi:sugar lactone lactonase YvrE